MFPVFSLKIITKRCKKNNHTTILRLFIINMFQIKLELRFKMLSKSYNTFGISQNLEVKKLKRLNCLNARNRPDSAQRTMTRFDSRRKTKQTAKLYQKKLNQISLGSYKSNSKRNIIMLQASLQITVKTNIHLRANIKHPNYIQTAKIKRITHNI